MKKLLFFVLIFMFVSCLEVPEWLKTDYKEEGYLERAIKWFESEEDLFNYWKNDVKNFNCIGTSKQNRAMTFCIRLLHDKEPCFVLVAGIFSDY